MSDISQGQDATAAKPLADVDELFPKQDVDDLFPADYKPSDQMVRNVSPIQDMIFSNPGRSHARVLDAFGYGFSQDWGAAGKENSDADDYMRKAGIFNDYAAGQRSIIKAANEAIMRPAIAAIVTGQSVASGLFHGTQAAIAQEGEEIGIPETRFLGSSAQLGRELAGGMEAFPTGIHQPLGIPHLPLPIAEAKSLDVIGAGEAGYFGTKPAEAEEPQAAAEAAKVQETAKPEALAGHDAEAPPSPVAPSVPAETPAPDIHAVARQIAPQVFSEFDALAQKKDTFRRWIDELREVRDQTAQENAPHAAEIADLEEKLKDATPRMAKKYQARLDPLAAERDAYLAEQTQGDSADMAKVRQQLMQTDYRMRDLAPDVSKAYRDAEEQMPQAEKTQTREPIAAAEAPPTSMQLRSGRIGPESEYHMSNAAVEEPEPYHQFTEMARSLPDDVNDKFQVHGLLAGNPDQNLIHLLTKGIDADREFHSGKPRGGVYGVDSTRTFGAPYLVLSDEGKSMHETGIKNIVAVGPAEANLPALKKAFPNINFMTVPEAETFMKAEKPTAEATEEAENVESETGVETHPPVAQPEVAQAAPAHAPSIVADVSQKLKAAGRPAPEADAAAQIVAAYWETRAQRFNGAKGTAAEMYAAEAPEIKLGKSKEKQPALEMAQTATRQGRIRIRDDGRNTITLLKNADASTFIHETGHDWLDRMLDDARDEQAPEGLRNDAESVLKWLGVDSPEAVRTRHHEKFARGFETYMLEGRAPSSALARVFAQFKSWLSTIYRTAAALKSPISDDIRGVFDRLLAEKPEKTVIAPERPAPEGLAEKHEGLAESTPPQRAREVANTIQTERDSNVDRNLLENQDNDTRLGNTGTGTEGRAARGAQPPGHADAAGAVGGEAETPVGPGAERGRGSEAAPEGAKPRKERERVNRQPTPLLNFIASQGGIKSSDALISDLRQSLGGNNRYVPGFGQLIRTPKQLSSAAAKAGRLEAMSIDRAREAAVEAGLLPKDATVADFIDAIDKEIREQGAREGRSADPAEQAHAEHNFLEGLDDTVKQAGGHKLSEAERARALELYRQEGLNDPAQIIERLALEADDAEIEHGAPERAEGIPGWDVAAPGWDNFDERPGASGAGAAIEGGQPAQPGGGAARARGEAESVNPLDANATLPRSESELIDKAGNIRLDNLGTPEDVNSVIRATAQELAPYEQAITRGRIPDADVLKLADALGMDAEKLSTRKLGETFNAEQIVAARKLLIRSATDVRDLAAKIAGGTEADVIAYAQARARHLMIQEQVSGLTAETGRALRAFRNLEGSKEAADISAFLKNTQGKTLYQMKEEGALLAMMETPQQVSKAVHEANLTPWQKVRSGILSWFINNLISGPVTHAGYSVGNTVVQLFKITVDTSAAAALGALRDAPAGERVYFGEIGAQLYGMVRGMRDGFGPAMTALKTGVPYMKGDVDATLANAEAHARPQSIPGPIGYVMETPSRAVTMIHTLHYGMNYEAEIARRAFRSAMKDGLDPGSDAFNRKIAEFTQSPPQADMTAAHDEAMKMVLMKGAQFGTAQYHLQKAVNSNILAKIVMPFMQVGANILHESYIERSPVGLMSQTVRDNLMGKNGGVARDTQAARIGIGIGISTAIIGLTAEGILTGGGPSDPKQLAVKEMTGWRPYSIKVGEAYVPYRKYLGGLGPLIAGTADMYEVGQALNEEGLTKAAASSLFGFAEVIADESWAKGLSNFIDAARHWDRDGGRYLRNLAADFIPFSIGLQQVTSLNDPYRREVRTLLDSARAHVPGLSQGLFPVRDIWGEPIESHTALGPSLANHDPATQALLDAGYYPGRLGRKIRGIELSGQQYDDFTRIGGRMARMRINALVNTPGFSSMPKQFQAEKIKDIITSARESARSMILMQNPDIIQKATEAKRAKARGEPATVH